MRVHLLTIVGLLNSVVIDCFLDEGPELGVLVDLSLAFRLLHIKLNLHFLHLLVEVGSEAETFLALLLQHGLMLQVEFTVLVEQAVAQSLEELLLVNGGLNLLSLLGHDGFRFREKTLNLREHLLLLNYAISDRLVNLLTEEFEVAIGIGLFDLNLVLLEYLLLQALYFLLLSFLNVPLLLCRHTRLSIVMQSLLVLLEVLQEVVQHVQLHVSVLSGLLLRSQLLLLLLFGRLV